MRVKRVITSNRNVYAERYGIAAPQRRANGAEQPVAVRVFWVIRPQNAVGMT